MLARLWPRLSARSGSGRARTTPRARPSAGRGISGTAPSPTRRADGLRCTDRAALACPGAHTGSFLWALVAEDYEPAFQVRQTLLTLVALIQDHARTTATTADPMREVRGTPQRLRRSTPTVLNSETQRAVRAGVQVFGHLDEILAILNAYLPSGLLLMANQAFAKNVRRDLEGILQRA